MSYVINPFLSKLVSMDFIVEFDPILVNYSINLKGFPLHGLVCYTSLSDLSALDEIVLLPGYKRSGNQHIYPS